MEEMELEEGEACSYHDNRYGDGYDSSMDPDVALSYIDDRLQHALGHFQKDFEGGVSAENLGAKFGGYGSFLPTYQRSPAPSRSPPKVRHDDAPKPSRNFHLEDGHHNTVVSQPEPQQARRLTACTSARSMPPLKDSTKREGPLPSICSKESDSRHESANLSNKKRMKLRLKVGSANASTLKKSAIYSGLGLGESPSSSSEESQSGSEGMHHEHQDAPLESPTSILQIMTSFPIHGDMLLSPLPDNLLKFSKMGNPLEDRRPVIVSGLGVHGPNYMKDIRKVPRGKKGKSRERNNLSTASESGKRKGSWNSNAVAGSKKIEVDTASEEMVSRTLQLPLLSNVDKPLHNKTIDPVEAFDKSREGNKSIMRQGFESIIREKHSDDPMEEETLNLKHINDCAGVEKPEVHCHGKFLEDMGEIPASNCLVPVKKGNHYKGEENYDIRAVSQKKDYLNMSSAREKASSGGKQKSKASQSQATLATDVSEGSLSGFSLKNRSMESIQEGDSYCKAELGKLKADRHFQNGRGVYKDFFGDVDFEEDQHKMVMQDSGTIKRSVSDPDSELRERPKSKMIANLSSTEAHPDAASGVGPGSGVSMVGAVPAAGFPPSEVDKGVYCIKCQKWRHFPPGTNRQNLPDKWVCSMLDWLAPGMNRCSVSQEETTNAVKAICQATVPDAQNLVNVNPGVSNIVSSSPQALPNSRHAKRPAEVSDVLKKNMQISAKNRSLNDINHSSLKGEGDLQQLSKSSHGRAEREAIKEELSKHSSEGGDVSKSKARGGHDRDHLKPSKKARNMGTDHNGEDWTRDYGVPINRTSKNSSSTSLTGIASENQKCHNEASSNVSADDTAGKSGFKDDHPSRKAAASMSNEVVEAGVLDEGGITTNTRKIKESQSYPTSLSYLQSRGHDLDENEAFVEESESKEGKVRMVNSKRKESSVSRRERRIDEESGQIKKVQSNNDLGCTRVAPMKKEPGLTPPPVPATSCSSKASGSLKSKASFHETRGSPAESVSSSPVRSSKPDNFTLARQTISEKHDFEDAAMISLGSPRKGSAGELVSRTNQSRSDGKDDTAAPAPNGSLESSTLDPDRDNLSGNSDKPKAAPLPDNSNRLSSHTGQDNFGHNNQYPTGQLKSGKCSAEEGQNEKSCDGSTLNVTGSEKVSASRSKDKHRKSQSEGIGNSKLSGSFKDKECGADNEGKLRDMSSNQENTYVKSAETERKHLRKKDSTGKPGCNSNRKNQSDLGDAGSSEDAVSNPMISSRKAEQVEIASGREKVSALPDVSTSKKEVPRDSSKTVAKSLSTNGVDNLPTSLSSGDDALKVPRQIKKADHQNGNQQKSSRHFASNGHRGRDVNAPSPARRDSGSHVAVNALKEAKDLKHLADRLKNGRSNSESIGLYFQASLKFLHGAALLESSNSESSKRGDIIQSIQIYGSTAKLCEFCAHEYEKSKDMASAALAYKCMEVAYLKVVYSSHNNASKDRQELLKMIPPDVDNVNNTANMEKAGQSKDASSPQVAGNQTIAATKKPNFAHLLNFAQDVSNAMEASKKSRIAFSAATASSADPMFKEAISSIKTALDYHFQDVEGLLRLVRLATEAISR
ncbi:uncharacterized protein LOC116209782 isoform X2 [Punica granatum]|uniref:Uncharacterized protein LOC116209782 isoform X2 n=1 Tax=Punica granatum TaxID=22663 RepID=A0A6P8E356_PUNGR|nr:uncharacterized protein LOC116209782 isoform X2 [Punica granatum]